MFDSKFMDKLDYSQTLFYLIQWVSKCYIEEDINKFIKSVDILESNLPEVRNDKSYQGMIKSLKKKNESIKSGVLPKKAINGFQNNKLLIFNKEKYDLLMDYMQKKGLLLITTEGDFSKDNKEFLKALKNGEIDMGEYEI